MTAKPEELAAALVTLSTPAARAPVIGGNLPEDVGLAMLRSIGLAAPAPAKQPPAEQSPAKPDPSTDPEHRRRTREAFELRERMRRDEKEHEKRREKERAEKREKRSTELIAGAVAHIESVRVPVSVKQSKGKKRK